MIPAAAGFGALLFLARWSGLLPDLQAAWRGPRADLEWSGATGRLAIQLGLLAVTVAVLAGAARPGAAFRDWIRWRGRAGRDVVSWALGLAVIAAAWEGLGLAGLVRVPVAVAAVLLLGAAGTAEGFRRGRGLRMAAGSGWLLAAGVAALVPALTPETEVDALAVHLALPDGWRAAGKITADPGHGVSGFPFALEALHLPGLLLGTELPARLLGWAGGLLAAGGTVSLAGRLGASAAVAWLAGAATLTMPQLFELATHAKNDALAAGLVTAALVALAAGGRAAIAAAGLLAGAAAATKLTAGLAIPAIAVALCLRRMSVRFTARPTPGRVQPLLPVSPLHLLLFFSCASLFLLPWSLRNLLTLGSPCFPALSGVFPVIGRTGVNDELMARYAFTWGDVQPAPGWAALRDLVRIIGGFSPVIGAGAVVLAATRASRRGAGWLIAFMLVYVAGWLGAFAWVSRYLLPALPAAVALAAASFAPGGRTGWLAGLVAISLAASLGGSGWQAGPLAAAAGIERPASYRLRRLGPYAEALTEVAARIPGTDRVVVAGDWRRYPSAGRLLAGMSDDDPMLRVLAGASADASRLAIKFRQRRIGWLLHHPAQATYWADYPMRFPWTPRAAQAWAGLWGARATLVWRSRPAQSPAGSAWLFRLTRTPGEPPFRGWLPGTEGEYAALRLLIGRSRTAPELQAAVGGIEAVLGARPELLARRAVIRAITDDPAGAARDLVAAVRAAPEAVPLWAEWGARVVPGDVWRAPDRLAAAIGGIREDHARWSALFNLGVPCVVPAEAARGNGY